MAVGEPLGLDYAVRALSKIKPKVAPAESVPAEAPADPVPADNMVEDDGFGATDDPGPIVPGPAIETPVDYRWWAACWPHERWARWERRWWAIRQERAREFSLEEVEMCKRLAYLELADREVFER